MHPCVQCKSELLLPNDLIGCIIGRGGTKINEIRQASQATIKISSGEDGAVERRITITGTRPAVEMARTMINNSIELHKHLLALNLALNSLYENHVSKREVSHLWSMADLDNQNELSFSNRRCNRINYTLPTVNEDTSFESCSAILNVELQSKHAALSGSPPMSSNTLASQMDHPVLLSHKLAHVAEFDHPCSTPCSATTHVLSEAEQESDGTISRKQILELIGQLPVIDQKRWLTAFGMEYELKPISALD